MAWFNEIEGTACESADPRFDHLVIANARIERLWTGGRWTEGPAWFPAGRYLAFSDIPNDRLLRYDETDGSVSVLRQPSNNINGNTTDRHGRLVSCEHGARRVTRTGHDGSVTVLADRFEGKRFNSPNDLVVGADGAVWFTDPPYGILSDYEGGEAEPEIGGCHVYRIDPSGAVTRVADDFDRPNGLAFSPDESLLYVADSGAPKHIRRFRVTGERLSGGEVFCERGAGTYDGLRLDEAGRVWTSCGAGVDCHAPDGARLGRIALPEIVSNVAFGGARRNRLFITATTSLYSVYLNTRGVGLV